MVWTDLPFLALDFETTGTDVAHDRIVQAAVLRIDPAEGNVSTLYHSIVDPGIEIPAAATAVHGIGTTYAREHGQNPTQALHAIAEPLATAWRQNLPVVIYYAPFDLTLLNAELARYGYGELAVGPILDPRAIDIGCDPDRPGRRRLETICPHYGITHAAAEAHSAYADAFAAARVAWVQARRYPEVAQTTLEELQTLQRRWHARREIQNRAKHARHQRSRSEQVRTRSHEWPLQTRVPSAA